MREIGRGVWGGAVPRSTEAQAMFWVPQAPKSVVPHCSPLVWVGGPERGGGGGRGAARHGRPPPPWKGCIS